MLEGTPTAAMAASYDYESRVPAIAQTKAEGLAKHYGVEGQGARYFTLHQTADVAHTAAWRNLIDANLPNSAEEQETVLAAEERAAKALWSALDEVERLRKAVIRSGLAEACSR